MNNALIIATLGPRDSDSRLLTNKYAVVATIAAVGLLRRCKSAQAYMSTKGTLAYSSSDKMMLLWCRRLKLII